MHDLNAKEGVSFLLAEQNTNMALHYAKYGYILENGRVVMDGEARALRENEDVKEFYLGLSTGRAQELPRREDLQAPQALAGLKRRCRPGIRRKKSRLWLVAKPAPHAMRVIVATYGFAFSAGWPGIALGTVPGAYAASMSAAMASPLAFRFTFCHTVS